MFRAKLIPVAVFALLLAAGSACAAEAAAAALKADGAKGRFLRLARDADKRPLALETAIVRCAPADGNRRTPTVDLVAAIHVADPAYYRQLNREFEGYDAVLYELVAAEEAPVPRPGSPRGNNPLSLLQNGIKDVLDLQFQLDGIDYTRKNMVHADMSPEQFAQSMQKRGETPLGMVGADDGLCHGAAEPDGRRGGNVQLLAALLDKNRAAALKRVVAEQFVDNGDALTALEGPHGSTLHERPQPGGPGRAAQGDRRRQEEDRRLLRRGAHAGFPHAAPRRLRPVARRYPLADRLEPETVM